MTSAILIAQAAASVRERHNGSAPTPEPQFPVDSFKDAAQHLRRPFSRQAVKFKVQATWPKDDPKSGLIVGYIDARLAVERLNLVCPHLWHDAYDENGKALLCHLTVDGITRTDLGEGYVGKGLYSDALKRAAVKFGIGVSLYAIPKIVLKASDDHLEAKGAGGKKTLVLTAKGEERCRKLYEEWLAAHGTPAFGQPLDHGDAEDSVGDPAGEVEAPDVEKPPAVATIAADQVARLMEIFQSIPSDEGDEKKLKNDLKLKLGSIGVSGSTVGQALAKLTPGQAAEVDGWLSAEVDKRAGQ